MDNSGSNMESAGNATNGEKMEPTSNATELVPKANTPSTQTTPIRDPEPAQIIPGVFLGSLAHAQSEEIVQKFNIQCILSIMSHKPRPPRNFSGTHKWVALADKPTEDIIKYFPGAEHFITEFLTEVRYKSAGRHERYFESVASPADHPGILIHCQMGVSRSASIVLAFLMARLGWELSLAHSFVKSKRPFINPNRGFWKQLLIWDSVKYVLYGAGKLPKSAYKNWLDDRKRNEMIRSRTHAAAAAIFSGSAAKGGSDTSSTDGLGVVLAAAPGTGLESSASASATASEPASGQLQNQLRNELRKQRMEAWERRAYRRSRGW